MRRSAWFALASLIAVSTPAAAENALLAQGRADVDALKFADAESVLAQARVQPGSSRAELLEILELQGVTRMTLGRRDDAEQSFHELLILDPTVKLPKRWGPKIQTIFFAARSWMDTQQPLTLTRLPPQADNGLISAVAVQVGPDGLKLASHLAVHFDPSAGKADAVVAVQPGAAMRVPVPSPVADVRWSARLLGPHDEVLVELGSPADPIADHVAGPVVLATPPPVNTPPPQATPAGGLAAQPAAVAETTYPYRPLAYGLGAAGVVAVGVGVAFGIATSSENSQLTSPKVNAQGQVTSLTQAQATALSKTAQQNALLADVFIASGSALVLGGGAVWIWGALNPEPGAGGEVGIAGRW